MCKEIVKNLRKEIRGLSIDCFFCLCFLRVFYNLVSVIFVFYLFWLVDFSWDLVLCFEVYLV